jgi:hypothetical protein
LIIHLLQDFWGNNIYFSDHIIIAKILVIDFLEKYTTFFYTKIFRLNCMDLMTRGELKEYRFCFLLEAVLRIITFILS